MNSTTKQYTCRLCAKSGCNYHPIFNTYSSSIATKIRNCLPIVINANDQLPGHICQSCFQALNTSDKLRSQCLLADSILRKQLGIVPSMDIKQEKEDVKDDSETMDADPEECNAVREFINVGRIPDWVCEFCGSEFKSTDDLDRNKTENHTVKTEYIEDSEGNDYSDEFSHSVEDNVTENSTNIAERINVHQNSEFICEFCEDEFKSSDDLLRHKHEEHYNETMYNEENTGRDPIDIKDENVANTSAASNKNYKARCDTCKVIIRDQELMELHIKFHQPRSMCCCYCNTNLSCPYDLYMHKKTVHRMWSNVQMKWFCERCETIIGDPRSARRHKTRCPKRMFQCQYCNQEYANKKDLISHQKKNHYEAMINDPNVEKFKCQFCEKTYVDRQVYMDHSRKHRAMMDEKYKCIYCEKIWPSSVSLKHHIQKTHDRQKTFKCDMCFKTFYTENNLKTHVKSHTKLACTECDKEFDDLQFLDEHLVQDHNMQVPKRDEFPCKLCGESFSKERFLRDHQNKHTGERPYACETCNKTFRTYSAHYAHVQGHRNSGVHCDYCKKKFSTKDVLKKHITKHQDPKEWRYHCEICNLKFRNHGMLQWHNEKYESTHLHTCDVCGLKVLGMHKLRRHKKHKHVNRGVNNSTS